MATAATTMPASVSASASGAVTQTAKPNYLAQVLASAGASPTAVAKASYYASINTAVIASEVYARRLLWEPIDDDQIPDWQQINDTAPTTWALINDDQNPNWTDVIQPERIDAVATFGGSFYATAPIAGTFQKAWIPNAEKWQEIDDTAPTVWTEIVQ